MGDQPALSHLAGLDPRQRTVATHRSGCLLVLAGPGAGKTRALTARVGHLLFTRHVDPSTVAAITFSRRAAAELRTRVAHLGPGTGAPTGSQGVVLPSPTAAREGPDGGASLSRRSGGGTEGGGSDGPAPYRAAGIWAGTIHAFGAGILRRGGAGLFERRPDFAIYDEDDTERTIRRILADTGPSPVIRGRDDDDTGDGQSPRPRARAVDPGEAMVKAISLVKRSGTTPDAVPGDDGEAPDLARILAAYEEALRLANAFDFDDLVSLAGVALHRDASLRDRVRARARHLLVDEFQDTDDAQVRLIEALDPPDICVVADPEQSIYGFRGASPDVVTRFLARWPGASIVHLDRNYRSTGQVVSVAQRLRDAAPAPVDGRTRVRLWTRNPVGDPIRTWATNHPEREARLVAADIAARIAAGTRPDQVAILVRTRAQMRPFEAVLLELEDLPFVVVGGLPFFGREEVRDILAYLRVALRPDDHAAFWRIVNVPRRGLGPSTALSIGRESIRPEATSRSPEAALRRLAAHDRPSDGAFDLLAIIDELRARAASGESVGDTLRAAIRLTGYQRHLEQAHPADARHRTARLETLASLADRRHDAREFLDDAVLATSVDDPRDRQGRIRLATIHAAKGTEYDHVYLPGCEDGTMPLVPRAAAGATDWPDPEERRVFYVGVTRARQSLTLSQCGYRAGRRVNASPFLAEVGPDLLLRCEPGTSVPLGRLPTRRPPTPSPSERRARGAYADVEGGRPTGSAGDPPAGDTGLPV